MYDRARRFIVLMNVVILLSKYISNILSGLDFFTVTSLSQLFLRYTPYLLYFMLSIQQYLKLGLQWMLGFFMIDHLTSSIYHCFHNTVSRMKNVLFSFALQFIFKKISGQSFITFCYMGMYLQYDSIQDVQNACIHILIYLFIWCSWSHHVLKP